tara:strand:+ start:290 stop:502 length:213 start_codon:yes stop_codon:yes gene_type:complete
MSKFDESKIDQDQKFASSMLEALVCPLTHSLLEYNSDTQELISRKAGLAFPIRDGIPIMLVDTARIISND